MLGREHAAIAQQRIENAGEATGEGDNGHLLAAARGDAQGPGPQRLGLRRVAMRAAVVCVSRTARRAPSVLESQRIAISGPLGKSSRRSSKRFAVSSVVGEVTPVTFAPGRARLGTSLNSTGSARRHHDRDRRRGRSGRHNCRRSGRDDNVWLQPRELRGRARKPPDISLRPSPLEGDGPALYITHLAHPLMESLPPGEARLIGAAVIEEANPRDFCYCLRLGRERRGKETAGQGSQERAAVHYSMT